MVFMKIFSLPWGLMLLLVCSPARATSFIKRSFPDAVKDAPVIVRGVIGMSYSDYVRDPGNNERIFTFYEVTPSEVLKGALADNGRVIVRELGGSKNGVSMNIPGASSFKRGEEVVLFLGLSNSDGSHNVRGMMMGKYWIESVKGEEYIVGPGALTPEEVEDGGVVHSEQANTRSRSTYTMKALRELIHSESKSGEGSPASGIPGQAPAPVASVGAPQPEQSAAPSVEPGTGAQAEAQRSSRWIWGALLLVCWWSIRRLRRRPQA
ncbi:hypothetical protein EBZ37_10050 [bacterium]|nr:hypothetical protein [bacterium]